MMDSIIEGQLSWLEPISKPLKFPDAPGHRGIDTSIAAAVALKPCLGRLQDMTLATIRAAGGIGRTAHECCDALGIDRSAIQPRLSELRRKGLIADNGNRRQNVSGKSAIVWVAIGARADG